MKHVKLFENFINEGNESVERQDLVDKYSEFKTLELKPSQITLDDDGVPSNNKFSKAEGYEALSSSKGSWYINAGEYPIKKVYLVKDKLNIKKPVADEGLVQIYLEHTQPSPYQKITATESWFEANCIFK